MALKLAIGILIGGAIGAFIGSSRSCESGGCPLTSNPYMGAIYGALMGFLIVSGFSGATHTKATTEREKTSMTTTTGHNAVIDVTSTEEFKDHVLNASVPVLVDLWASWCGPCRAQSPIVEQLAVDAGDRAKVVKINVDDAGDLATALGVQSIPTLVVFKNGKESQRFVGVQSAAMLKGALGV